MSKIVIDIKGKPKKDDVLVFDGEEFCPVNISFLLKEIKSDTGRNSNQINSLNGKINNEIRDVYSELNKIKEQIKLILGEENGC